MDASFAYWKITFIAPSNSSDEYLVMSSLTFSHPHQHLLAGHTDFLVQQDLQLDASGVVLPFEPSLNTDGSSNRLKADVPCVEALPEFLSRLVLVDLLHRGMLCSGDGGQSPGGLGHREGVLQLHSQKRRAHNQRYVMAE